VAARGSVNQGGRNFDRRVAAGPRFDGGVLGGPEQLGIGAIELGANERDRTAVSAAERQKPVAAAETSDSVCGSVEASMWLFSTALARRSPKVLIGILTSSRQELGEGEPRKTERGGKAEAAAAPEQFWEEAEKKNKGDSEPVL
jgi:hypothetical protein